MEQNACDKPTPEGKKAQLYLWQKKILQDFLDQSAILKVQYDKIPGDPGVKLGMKIMEAIAVHNRAEFRKWYEQNAATESECWVLLRRGKARPEHTLPYLDALEESLCFGWIDSTSRPSGNGLCLQRFSPRRKGSLWTELNKARVERLLELGMMAPSGIEAYKSAKPFVIDPEIKKAFDANPAARQNFTAFSELYRRVRIDTIQRYKENRKQFDDRLRKLMEFSERGEMFGEWNDGGRLLG